MKYDDASSLEERNKDNLFEIRFYFESDWWRAYEWSAYLAAHYKTSDAVPLKPTKKTWSGNKDGIILVGLKTQSFKKYFPELKIDDLSLDKREVVIKCDGMFNGIEFGNYKSILNEWKRSVDLKDVAKTKPLLSDVFNENNVNYALDGKNVDLKAILKAQNKILEGIIEINNQIMGSNS